MFTVLPAAYQVLMSRPVRRLARPVTKRLPVSVRRALHARLEEYRAGSERRAGMPRLSVVVPVYNVEAYVGDALDSLVSQTLTDWEAIVVDDGSTDRSGEIVNAYADDDSRIRVIHQGNAGLGAARNAGIQAATGTYLTFLDADDLIPPQAYKTAVETLRKTGSDFAIGATQRLDGQNSYTPAWSRHLHARPFRRVTLDSVPDAMMDVIAGNRIVKTSFWRKHIGAFPTGMAYEDHRVMVTAFVRARCFDVLSTVTYLWRVRGDGASISQHKMDKANLIDRMRAHEEAFGVLRAEANAAARAAWLTRVLDMDVPLFAEYTATAADDYRRAAQQFARRYVTVADAEPEAADIWAGVRWQQRVIALLMAAGRWKDLEQFSIDVRGRTGVPGTSIDDAGVRLDMRRWEEPIGGLLAGRDRLGERHTRLYARIDHQEWLTEGLRLSGFAYIAHVQPDASAPLELSLVNQRTGSIIALASAEPVHNPQANRFANHPYFDYSGAGFDIVVDWPLLARLFEAKTDTPTDSWELRADLTWHSVPRSAAVDTTLRRGSAGALRSEPLPGYALSVGPLRVPGALQFQARRIFAALETFDVHDDEHLAGLVAVPPRDGYVPTRLCCGAHSVPLHPGTEESRSNPAWRTYTFQGLLPGNAETDHPVVTFANGDQRRLVWAMPSVDVTNISSTVSFRRSHFGFVDIVPGASWLAHRAVCTDNTLTVWVESARTDMAHGTRFALQSTSTAELLDADRVESNHDGGVTVAFDLDRLGPTGKALRGTYCLRADEEPVIPADRVLRDLPHAVVTGPYRVELLRAPASQHGSLTVSFGPPLGDHEHGPWAQSQLQERFRTENPDPIRAVLFQCYRGELATDSQKAIHHELVRRGTDLGLYWGVQDGTVTVPPQGVPVIIGSARWYQLLGAAEYLCNNIDFDRFFFRRQHQRFLQTFHGHPFKAMGKTYWRQFGQHGPGFVEHEARRRQQLWTCAVMPNAESTAYYKAEYGLEHGMIITGYPRTDQIVVGDAAVARKRIAATFDIPEDSNWILHAPTWRETLGTGTWSATRFDELNLTALTAQLGSDWTILVRGHSHNARENARIRRQETIIDVTDYPEINDLILAADAAVLDYSSLRFDWAITRKPMVFFVPDKVEYLTLRPGLFEYEESAPGRQVRTTDAVAEALVEADHYEAEYGPHLDQFNARFNSLSDGHAAERVVDAVIGSCRSGAGSG